MQRIMKHFTYPSFWDCYQNLPESIQQLADKNFKLLKEDVKHPSLHLKKISKDLWCVRVGMGYRALAIPNDGGNLAWFWIGTHREYERLIK